MSFSTKAKSLIYSLPLFQRLADIHARRAEAEHVFAPGFEAKPQLVMWTDVLPLLWSVGSIGIVTALLFALNEPIAANLVPIAYLIPIIYVPLLTITHFAAFGLLLGRRSVAAQRNPLAAPAAE